MNQESEMKQQLDQEDSVLTNLLSCTDQADQEVVVISMDKHLLEASKTDNWCDYLGG